MADLTPAEQAFFATGELPAELLEQSAALLNPTQELPAQSLDVTVPAPATTSFQADSAELLRRSMLEEQERRIRTEAELADLKKQMEAFKNPTVAAPDPNTDPLGNMMHQLQQVNANVTELQQKLTQEQQQNSQKQQFDQFTNSIREIKATFEKTVPDFADAYAHIRAVRTEDLRAVGIPEAQIPQILLQDELNIAHNALQKGKNPAEEMYNMGKRYGYIPKSAPQTSAEKIATLQKGAAAAKSPQRAAAESELTLEGLKDAGDHDINKIVQDDKQWAKLVGGTSHDIFS